MSLAEDFAKEIEQRRPSATSPLAEQFAAEIEGVPYDPVAADGKFVGQARLDDSTGLPRGTRLKFMAADTIDEKQLVFQNAFPNGELIRIPGSGTLAWKRDKSDSGEQYKTIEPDAQGVTASLVELADDLGDFLAPNIGPLATDLVVGVMTRGLGRIRRALALGPATAVGGVVQEDFIEPRMTGIPNRQTAEMRGIQLGTDTLAGTLGAAGADVAQLAVSPLLGRGIFKTSDDALHAGDAIDLINQRIRQLQKDRPELNLQEIPTLSPGQLAEAPILARWESLSAAIAAPIRQHREAQIRAATDAFNAEIDSAAIDGARRAAGQALRQENKSLNDLYDVRRGKLSEAKLNEGVLAYKENSRIHVDNLYAAARAIEAPKFNPQPLQQYAQNQVFRSPMVRMADGTVKPAEQIDPKVNELLREVMDAIPEDITDKTMRAWRSRANDLAQPAPGVERSTSQKLAANLASEIRKTLDNPLNKGAKFKRAWKQASDAASDRFSNLEKSIVVKILKAGTGRGQETMQQLVRSLAQPGQADNLKYLKTILKPDEWDQFRRTAMSDLAAQPEKLRTFFEGVDPETLRFLLPRGHEKAMRDYLKAYDALESSGVRAALQRQSTPNNVINDLINRSDSAGVLALTQITKRNGGFNGPLGKALRAGLMERAFNRIVSMEGKRKVKQKAANDILREYRNMGFDKLLTTEDRQLLRNMGDIADTLNLQALDAGSSLQAAEVGSGLLALKASALIQYMRKATVGRFLLTKEARALLMGDAAKQPLNSSTLQALGAAGASVIQNSSDSEIAEQLLLQELDK